MDTQTGHRWRKFPFRPACQSWHTFGREMLAKQKISKWLTDNFQLCCFTHISLWRHRLNKWSMKQPANVTDSDAKQVFISLMAQVNISCHLALIFPRNLHFFKKKTVIHPRFGTQNNNVWIKHGYCQGLSAVLSHKGASSRYDLCFPFPCPFHITPFFFRLFSLHSLYLVLHLLPLQLYVFNWKHGKSLCFYSILTFVFYKLFIGLPNQSDWR